MNIIPHMHYFFANTDRGSLAEKLAPEIFYNEEVLEYFQVSSLNGHKKI